MPAPPPTVSKSPPSEKQMHQLWMHRAYQKFTDIDKFELILDGYATAGKFTPPQISRPVKSVGNLAKLTGHALVSYDEYNNWLQIYRHSSKC
jgi:hypothetical protein